MSNIALIRAEVKELEKDIARLESRTNTMYSQFIALLSITRRLSGSEDFNDLITVMIRAYAVGMSLLALLQAINLARLASGDPTAILGLIVAGGAFGVSLYSFMEIRRPTY